MWGEAGPATFRQQSMEVSCQTPYTPHTQSPFLTHSEQKHSSTKHLPSATWRHPSTKHNEVPKYQPADLPHSYGTDPPPFVAKRIAGPSGCPSVSEMVMKDRYHC